LYEASKAKAAMNNVHIKAVQTT